MKTFNLVILLLISSCASVSADRYPDVVVDQANLEEIISTLASDIGPRNHFHYSALQASSKYIQKELEQIGLDVSLQKYMVSGAEYENVIVSIGPVDAERIIVGAHYDSFGDQVGADDNASGIAGLIELVRLLKPHEAELNKRIDFVAYSLEEPPFFRTEYMGSYIHANSLKESDVNVSAMICLEMIGYFSDEEGSQSYPIDLMKLMYPDKGSFIGIISNMSSRGLKSEFRKYMSYSDIDVQALSAPPSLVGVDFSDHLNYWSLGYDAIMITDTAFYRNHNYHERTDTIETLNFTKMASVVKGVYFGLLNMASR
jgi:Peptidase family M28